MSKIVTQIIHLERSSERREHITQVLIPQLSQNSINSDHAEQKKEICIFPAIDGAKLGLNNQLMEEHGIAWKKPSMWPGQVGCFLSHFLLWNQLCQESRDETSTVYLVMEDDTEVAENYHDTFWREIEDIVSKVDNMDNEWKWIYLWTNPDCDKRANLNIQKDEVVRSATATYGTVAYLIHPRGARYLRDTFKSNGLHNAIDDCIMQMIQSGEGGFYTSMRRVIDTVGPIYYHERTGLEKLGSTVV